MKRPVNGADRGRLETDKKEPARRDVHGPRSCAHVTAVSETFDARRHRTSVMDDVLFHGYFHGDRGRGIDASHQTRWTGLVAKLLQPRRQGRER